MTTFFSPSSISLCQTLTEKKLTPFQMCMVESKRCEGDNTDGGM